jgi:hypothetical protein
MSWQPRMTTENLSPQEIELFWDWLDAEEDTFDSWCELSRTMEKKSRNPKINDSSPVTPDDYLMLAAVAWIRASMLDRDFTRMSILKSCLAGSLLILAAASLVVLYVYSYLNGG